MVDLPGYGFALASKTEMKEWKTAMQRFLDGRDFTIMRLVT
jgi:GTP-binding protein EngB required for normal cell division